jgi:putative phosphoesterase
MHREVTIEGMLRVGVVADTHSPEFLPELPPALFERLRGVDLIVHAGDVGGEETLRRLRELAPVEAVRGDHDAATEELPPWREVALGSRRLVIVHGNRSHLIEEPVTLLGTLSLGLLWPGGGIVGALRARFPHADVIVYGHTHRARVDEIEGAMLFNPGAVYMVTAAEAERRLRSRPSWFQWCWLQIIRHRLDTPVPSVGILEIPGDGGGQVRARVYPLCATGTPGRLDSG